MRKLAIALAVLCSIVIGCGDSASDETACGLLDKEQIVGALRAAGVEEIVLRPRSSESVSQSICSFRGEGTTVRLNIDSAAQARRRYFNRVTEAAQLGGNDPGRNPKAVQGLGDEDALGPAGAFWIDDFRQLFVLRGERQFVYQLSAPGLGADAARRAAVQLARATLPGKARDARAQESEGGTAALDLDVLAPLPDESVRSDRVVVRGTVSGRDVAVRVAGRPAAVRNGIFARAVPLRPGRNTIRVSATGAGQARARTLTVRRGRSGRSEGEAFARRRPGVMPDVLAEPLGDAQAILAGAGLGRRVVKLADGSLRSGHWVVCRTKPIAGARVRGAVTLFADRQDLFRTSGTVCAYE